MFDKEDPNSCLLVYSKRPAWFGLVRRWHVYSIRGGPTLSLREYTSLIWTDRIAAKRSAAYRGQMLDEIGADELRKCDVNSFLDCVERQKLEWSECQDRLAQEVALWQSRRLSHEELRELVESGE